MTHAPLVLYQILPAPKREALAGRPRVSWEGRGRLLCLEKCPLVQFRSLQRLSLFCGISDLHWEERCLHVPAQARGRACTCPCECWARAMGGPPPRCPHCFPRGRIGAAPAQRLHRAPGTAPSVVHGSQDVALPCLKMWPKHQSRLGTSGGFAFNLLDSKRGLRSGFSLFTA